MEDGEKKYFWYSNVCDHVRIKNNCLMKQANTDSHASQAWRAFLLYSTVQ